MYIQFLMILSCPCRVVAAPTNPSVIFHRTPEPSTFPGAPSKPQVSEVTETNMKLAWKANANHGASPIIAYTVEYFSHETGEVRAPIHPPPCGRARGRIQGGGGGRPPPSKILGPPLGALLWCKRRWSGWPGPKFLFGLPLSAERKLSWAETR